MREEARLLVGDADVSPAILKMKWGQTLGQPSELEAVLKHDSAILAPVDLGGRAVAEVGQSETRARCFTGLVVRAWSDDDGYHLHCMDPSRKFQELPAMDCFGKGLHHAEIIYYIAKSVHPEGADPANFFVDHQRTLAEVLFTRRRRFVYAASLPFCELAGPEVRIGEARLYRADQRASADDRVMASCLQNGIPAAWRDGVTLVQFYVMATGLMEAFEQGAEKLSQLHDYLSFSANVATPCYELAGVPVFLAYDRDRTLTSIRDPDWAYVRDTVGTGRYWLRGFRPHRFERPFALAPDDPLLAPYRLFQHLLSEDAAQLRSAERALLRAVHAFRQSRQAASTMDGLMHLWNCVECLLAGFATDSVFAPDDREAISQAARAVVADRHADACVGKRERMEARVDSLLKQLNNEPLQTKWNAFCIDRAVVIQSEDGRFLWGKLRRFRNDYQHGRSAFVSREDLDRGCAVVEKALIAGLRALMPGARTGDPDGRDYDG